MEQYFYKIPKIVTAVQIDFNNYQNLTDEEIIKYCQELYKQNQETLIELNSLKEQVKELLS